LDAETEITARTLLGVTQTGELLANEKLQMKECIASAHREILNELARSIQNDPTMDATRSTLLMDEGTTVLMATKRPEWVLRRHDRLTQIEREDPSAARIFRLVEYAGCAPVEVADMMRAQDPTARWTEGRVRRKFDEVRSYCY
jgi:hypothetical protein